MTAGAPRTALVTGASSGIGAAMALVLARRGWRLALTGRDPARLSATAERCAAAGARACEQAVLDIRDAERFGAFVDRLGAIDLYIGNAGVLDGRRAGEAVESRAVALDVLSVNLTASVDCLHRLLEGMLARGSGQIVLVSSLAGLSPLADAPAYSASKAGLVSYGLALRRALHESGIGVTVACPGYVETPMTAEHQGKRPGEVSAEAAARRIIEAGLRNRTLCGFPLPLYPAARLSLLAPEWLSPRVTSGLRFTVAKA